MEIHIWIGFIINDVRQLLDREWFLLDVFFIDFWIIWVGLVSESVPRTATSFFVGEDQFPLITWPRWRICKCVSVGSRRRKEMPSFFEISLKAFVKVTEWSKAFLILSKYRLEESSSLFKRDSFFRFDERVLGCDLKETRCNLAEASSSISKWLSCET